MDEPQERAHEAYWANAMLKGGILWNGVNNRMPMDKLPPGLINDGQNTRMRNGDIEPRLGVGKPGWLNHVSPGVDNNIRPAGTTLNGAGIFRDPNSTEWTLVAADARVYACRPNNARQALALPEGVELLGPCYFAQAFDRMFIFRGRYLAPLVMENIDAGFIDLIPHWKSAALYNTDILAVEQPADEIAYGPFLTISSLTSVADVATVVTNLEHGYVTGADITITGANQASYNGRFNITVLDPHTFTYQFTGNATPTATGTAIKCSNMGNYWKAAGSRVTLTTLTRGGSGNSTATATKTNHGFTSGQYVTISGADQAAYNGTFPIFVTNTGVFTYDMGADPGADATGSAIYAQTSIVFAGQSPDSNPEAWQQLYDVLPNADDALFVNNMLLVPTAYTPGAAGYDSTSSYAKKDYIVATNYLDYIHFQFVDEFRINQGDDSEIECLAKYDNNTVIVCKGRCWGILSGLSQDLSQLTFDLRGGYYGACAPRSAIAAGKNVYFPVTQRGVVSLNQTVQGLIQSVDVALSNDVDKWIRRIAWLLADLIRLAWWNDCLYVAAPLDGGTLGPLKGVNNALLVYDFRTQQWAGMDTGGAICPKEFFTAQYCGRERLFFIGFDGWVNMVEEATSGDQVEDSSGANGLSFADIEMRAVIGGDVFGQVDMKRFPMAELALASWNAKFSITASTGTGTSGMKQQKAVAADMEFDRLKYLKPFDRVPYSGDNANGDFNEPDRGDYSVALGGTQTLPFEIRNGVLVPLPNSKVLKMWDTGKTAWQFLRIVNDAPQITDRNLPNGDVVTPPDPAVLIMWDDGKSAWQYFQIVNGIYQITDYYGLLTPPPQPAVVIPPLPQFPFASNNGQIVPVFDGNGTLIGVKLWDAGLNKFVTWTSVNGQLQNDA